MYLGILCTRSFVKGECYLIFGQKLLRLTALFQLEDIRKSKDNARLLFVITLHDTSNIYLHKVAWACPTLRIVVGFATHILICYNSVSSMYSICLFTEVATTIEKITAIEILINVDGMIDCVEMINGPAKPPHIAPT